MSHIQNCSLKIYLKSTGGGGGGGSGWGVQDGCERRIKVFVKIQKKKKNFFWGGGGSGRGGGVGSGGQGRFEQRSEVFCGKKYWGGGGLQGGCDKKLKFL